MNWQEILFTVISLVITGLVTYGFKLFYNWLNAKLKDGQGKKYLLAALDVVKSVVKETYQTYVQNLKLENAFTKEEQTKALNMALEQCKRLLSDNVKEYIEDNFGGGIDKWITTIIEAYLYDLKNGKKQEETTNENS